MRAPAYSAASCTARCSTPVMPDGTQITMRGLAKRRWCTLWMKKRSIFSQISKSAMTPSFRGRMASMWAGVRPIMRLASVPTARTRPSLAATATTDGSFRTMPPTPHVDEGVGGPEVDGHVAAHQGGDRVVGHGTSGRTALGRARLREV